MNSMKSSPTCTRAGYEPVTPALFGAATELLDALGPAGVALATGLSGNTLRSVRDRTTVTVASATAEAIRDAHASLTAGEIAVATLPRTRNAHGVVYVTVEGDLIRALYSLTNRVGVVDAARRIGCSRVFVRQMLTGHYERTLVSMANDILLAVEELDAEEAPLEVAA